MNYLTASIVIGSV